MLLKHSSFGFIVLLILELCHHCHTSEFKCSTGHFKCGKEQNCIPNNWICDGESDCEDSIDEKGCGQIECKAEDGMFRCDSGECIRSNWRCDGDTDCKKDGSDEKGCKNGNFTCASMQFTCGDRTCIPKKWVCDHDKDCADGSDEQNCREKPTCMGDMFSCKNGRCIAVQFKCDMDNDCADGSDEDINICPAVTCNNDQFTCSNRRCISQQWICDNEDDCGDKSDEQPHLCKSTPTEAPCNPDHFQCKKGSEIGNGKCIPIKWKCDGERDCTDGFDEENCQFNITCKSNDFKCSNGSCIDISKKCDMVNDCADGEDEKNCNYCGSDQFRCVDSRRCIPKSKVCDAHNDCEEKEDEPFNYCNINECKDNNGHCSHICVDKVIGFECRCNEGYQLGSDGRTCEDKNECMIYGSCSQICENTKGSYKCSCLRTYKLEYNRRSCKALGQKPNLIYSERHSIRNLNFEQSGLQLVASDLSSAIGISFDFAEGHVYWTDIREKVIKRVPLSSENNAVQVRKLEETSSVDGIAVDWIGRKLYLTDHQLDRIEVSELDGSSALVLLDLGPNTEPRGIALDPTEKGRHLYWTDWGKEAKIEKISMDGDPSTRVVLHNLTGCWPNGIAIDYALLRIYWTDAKIKVIESSRLDGTDRQRILEVPDQHPFLITVFEDFMYWSEWSHDRIFKANRFTGGGMTGIASGISNLMGIEIYHPLRQPAARNPCAPSNGGCSHLCLLSSKYAYPGYTCKCPNGVELLSDRQTCNTTSAYVCTPNYCLNGGHCVNNTSKRYLNLKFCKCPRGYRGKRCQKRSSIEPITHHPNAVPNQQSGSGGSNAEKEDLGETIGIAAGVVLGILLVAGICIYLFYLHLRKSYRERKAVNFDNPVYRRTTEDSIPIMEMSYEDNQL